MIRREISEDASPQNQYPPVSITIDDEGDVWLLSEDGTLMMSLKQAYAVHFQLGQAIIEFQRAWGASHASMKATND